MPRATLNGEVLAESLDTIVVEGNHYFPAHSIRREFFSDSPKTSMCPWKGQARYYDVEVDGKTAKAAAWYYPEPLPAAAEIADHVAFWGEVDVTD